MEKNKKKGQKRAGIYLLMMLGSILVSAVAGLLTMYALLYLQMIGVMLSLTIITAWVVLVIFAKNRLKERKGVGMVPSLACLAGVPLLFWCLILALVFYMDANGMFGPGLLAGLFWFIWSLAGVIGSAITLFVVMMYCLIEYVHGQNNRRML